MKTTKYLTWSRYSRFQYSTCLVGPMQPPARAHRRPTTLPTSE